MGLQTGLSDDSLGAPGHEKKKEVFPYLPLHLLECAVTSRDSIVKL